MNEPKRYKVGKIGTTEMIDCVSYEDYARLKAEVERYSNFVETAHVDLNAQNARLKAEVERLTKQVERLIVSLHKSHDEHAEALYKLKYKNERQTPRKKRSS